MAADTYAPRAPIREKPNSWKSGPDWTDHQKYYAWLKHRSQATYRGEKHSLTWNQWQKLWPNDLWNQRGRAIDDVCLTRIDPTKSWNYKNCEIITRHEQFIRQGAAKRGILRGPYTNKQL